MNINLYCGNNKREIDINKDFIKDNSRCSNCERPNVFDNPSTNYGQLSNNTLTSWYNTQYDGNDLNRMGRSWVNNYGYDNVSKCNSECNGH